jgi:hypothetical protein
MSKPRQDTLLQCSLPPKEALRRAMMIEPPLDWKKQKPVSKPRAKKASR